MEHVDVIKVDNPIPDSRGVRSKEWKYLRYVNIEPEVEELYHISLDTRESTNLAKDPKYKGIRDQMAGRYDYYLKSFSSH